MTRSFSPSPRLPFPTEPQPKLDALEAAALHGDLAALIFEPLVLGAGGMLFYSPQVLAQMAEIRERDDHVRRQTSNAAIASLALPDEPVSRCR